MPARKPLAAAKSSGAILHNPARFKNRSDPAVPPLGGPSRWLSAKQRVAWESFRHEIPWLAESDRTLVEIASVVRARLIAGEDVGVQALNLLRQAIGQMGGTPADRTRITVPDAGNKTDPASGYFTLSS